MNEEALSVIMNEYDLKLMLLHIAKGLAYMHSLDMVHLDIKPGNIFICRAPRRISHHQSKHPTIQESVNKNGGGGGGFIVNEESGIESEEGCFDDDDDDACALTISNKTRYSTQVKYVFYINSKN